MKLTTVKWTICGIIAMALMLASTTNTVIKSMLFKKIDVPSSVLEDALRQQGVGSFSLISCILQGAQRDWSHLVCYNENNYACTLYDVKLASNYQPVNGSNTLKCYTNIIHQGYQDSGETADHDQQTTESSTDSQDPGPTDHDQQTTESSTDCPEGFVSLSGVGCIVIVKTYLDYEQSQEHCQSINTTLAMPNDYEALRQFIICSKPPWVDYRVGVYNKTWLDGRTIHKDDWTPGQPDADGKCGYMGALFYYRVHDYYCSPKY